MKPRSLLLLVFLFAVATSGSSAELERGEMLGYLLFDGERVPEEFNAGFSFHAAAWPLVDHYPGHDFQTGLLGTWMFPLWEPGQKPKEDCYTDIEGGLGWWRDTHFPTTTPKFIMGGVGPNFSVIANGPGYGDLPLPLTDPKSIAAGRNVPTGNQCWTLFLNTAKFKGPAAFFTPYFWSRAPLENPQWAGKLLDSAPSDPNKAIQMETQHIPAIFSTAKDGTPLARMAPTAGACAALPGAVIAIAEKREPSPSPWHHSFHIKLKTALCSSRSS